MNCIVEQWRGFLSLITSSRSDLSLNVFNKNNVRDCFSNGYNSFLSPFFKIQIDIQQFIDELPIPL